MHYNAIIVGAGLAGNKIAESLSKKGLKVLVLEEHKKVGFPSKCSGLVSERIFDYLPMIANEVILNEIKSAEFIFKDLRIELKPKNRVFVIDRIKLDEILYRRAIGNGAEYKFGERFLSANVLNDRVEVKTNKGLYSSDILVGADGSFSTVAKNFGLFQDSEYFIGYQSTIKGKFEKEKVEVWFGNNIAPNFFGWVIPINEYKARIGLATREKPLYYYKKFLRKRVKNYFEPDTVGIIKIGLMKKTVFNRVLVVGDAAMQVKPFSGGGIIYNLISSQIASLAILKAYKQKNYTEEFLLENYEKTWKEKLGKAIRKGLILRKLFYSFGDRSIEFWFKILPYLKGFLQSLDYDLL